MKKSAQKDVDINKDIGSPTKYKDLSKPPRVDRENPFSKKKIKKEYKEDFKDTSLDPDLKTGEIMNNKKIANKLNRIARELMTSGYVANTKGAYMGFTGKVDWGGSKGNVSRAVFELDDNGIVFSWGVWRSGVWEKGVWEKGVWEGGVWKGGTWKGGIWQQGRDGDGNLHLRGDSPDKW